MNKKNQESKPELIPPHGGYRNLKSYQTAEIIYDATAVFCNLFVDKRSRTYDQMVQAARSGKQNIAEGSMVSGTSKKNELKLIGVARASLEELLLDYHDFLRQRRLLLWEKSHPQAQAIRKLAWEKNRSYMTYKTYIESSPPQKLQLTHLFALYIRQIIYLTSNYNNWKNNSWKKAASQKNFIRHGNR
jgi:four helix bundle protein